MMSIKKIYIYFFKYFLLLSLMSTTGMYPIHFVWEVIAFNFKTLITFDIMNINI